MFNPRVEGDGHDPEVGVEAGDAEGGVVTATAGGAEGEDGVQQQ